MNKKNKIPVAITLSLLFLLAALYFVPTPLLKGILPASVVKYRIIGPLLVLTLASIRVLPWRMVLAMAFSLAGDFMGAYGSFPAQMGFFALAHIMLIWQFALWTRWKLTQRRHLAIAAIAALLLFCFALVAILPYSPAGALRTGCTVYAFLICTMLALAWISNKSFPFLALGASLFLLSDMILSWNMFVAPLKGSRYLIMLPYYSGQVLIYLAAGGLPRSEKGRIRQDATL